MRAQSLDEEEFFDVLASQEEADSRKRKPRWLLDTLKEAETVGAPKKRVRESRSPERFSSYIAMVTSIVKSEPSSYEEAAEHHVWRKAMAEEYSSIMKNDVWEVVPRHEGKSVVTSRWLYKIKYAVDGSIEKYKARFVARGFSQVEGGSRSSLHFYSFYHIDCSRDGVEDPPDRCEDRISERHYTGGGVH